MTSVSLLVRSPHVCNDTMTITLLHLLCLYGANTKATLYEKILARETEYDQFVQIIRRNTGDLMFCFGHI